jgi:penicillin-binding protein-related factor A (putative recombinase)
VRLLFKRKQVHIGREFESIFHHRAEIDGWSVDRIADGCKTFGKGKMFREAQPYDFVGHKDGRYFFVDTKSWGQNRFHRSDVKEHQATALHGKESINGMAGYVVWFRSLDKVVFYSATKLLSIKFGEGLSPEDGISLGTLQTMDLRHFGETNGLDK